MCPMPKTLSYARQALNSLPTLLDVLSARERLLLMEPTLPAIVSRLVHLDVEDCSKELLRQQSNAIKNKLGHPKPTTSGIQSPLCPTRGFGTENTPIGRYLKRICRCRYQCQHSTPVSVNTYNSMESTPNDGEIERC